MSARTTFWQHVQAALDARRDPLEVPEVQRHLAEEPALLDELAALREGLELLAQRKRTRVRSLGAATVFLGLAGLAGAWHAARWSTELPEPLRAIDLAVVATPEVVQCASSLSNLGQRAAGSPAVRPASSHVIAFRAEVSLAGPLALRTAASGSSGSSLASATDREDDGTRIHVRTLVAVANVRSSAR